MKNDAKKLNLSVRVEETLRDKILNLEYPHNHILGEETLCAEFGVSRSPVREALRLLEASGLIHKMSNRSYAVKQISQNDIKELYELRLALERYVVEHLCTKEYTDELVQLLVYWQNLEFSSSLEVALADRNFHESLAAVYGNKAIQDSLFQINERLRVFRAVDLAKTNRIASTKEQHIALLRAVHSKDTLEALKYIELNINEGLENSLEALRQAILRAYER